LIVSDMSTNEVAARTMPKVSAARGETRPDGTGRVAVRPICASMSRSYQWLTAPAPPADRYPPRQVSRISPTDGEPATSMVVTVVSRSSDCTLGLVRSR
jgi:hypothetical protein